MIWNELFIQAQAIIASPNLPVPVILFLLCLISEALVISIVPYLLEVTWLLAGYQLSHGTISIPVLLLLLLAAHAGRQGGALVLYYMSRGGSRWLSKYLSRFKPKSDTNGIASRILKKVNTLSPFSVALGRLLWVRIPLTIILAAGGKLRVLMESVVLSSLAYDFTCLGAGAILGVTTKLEPGEIVLFCLGGMTGLYLLAFAVRKIVTALIHRRQVVTRVL